MVDRAPELSPDEMSEVVRFGIHDDPGPETVDVFEFMLEHGLDRSGMAEALREYRDGTCWSPWSEEARDALTYDFMQWFEWERIG